MKKEIRKGVSVIIPTFNRVKFLYPTLVCLCNQKIEETMGYEIIIVDSGDDETEAMVRKFQHSGKITIVYKKLNDCKNRSLLRNKGANLAKFTILCFLDNDMLVSPNFIQIHFDAHKNEKNLIYLGMRRFLTDYDFSRSGIELLEDFMNLNRLPWYEEERGDINIEIQSWRFVFSHSFSIQRDDFYKIGGFNTKFGERWGLEDLELGVRLQRNHLKIQLCQKCVSYHQPHFLQSCENQNSCIENSKLFVSLHNYYEIELYKCFSSHFNELYFKLKKIHQKQSFTNKKLIKNYDLIFGYLRSIDDVDDYLSEKMQLGIYCIKKSNSCENILILNSFFDFPEIIQVSLLFEAFRVGRIISFIGLNNTKIEKVINQCLAAGIVVKIYNNGNKICFEKEWDQTSKFYTILLPDVFQPEKRYVYIWLANYLLERGYFIKIRDTKCIKSFDKEDYNLSNECKQLSGCVDKSFGKNRVQFIGSKSMLFVEQNISFPKTKATIVITDDDYEYKFEQRENKYFSSCMIKNNVFFQYLSFLSVSDICLKKIENTRNNVRKKICCFMENGYYEDNIGVVIDSFYAHFNHSEWSLIIKMPNYDDIIKIIYPRHNPASKYSKIFSIKQKYENDYFQLCHKIDSLNLKNQVKILKENMSIFSLINFINSCDCLIDVSKMLYTPIQVYIAVLLKLKVIVPDHKDFFLSKFCVHVESKKYEFADKINVPVTNINSNYFVYSVNEFNIKDAIEEQVITISDGIIQAEIQKAKEMVENGLW